MRLLWIGGWALALAAGASAAILLRNPILHKAESDQPDWLSITTAKLTEAARDCYRREAAWQATAYCASAPSDVLEVVWASCFAEEKELLLASIVDSRDDQTAMEYLSHVEAGSGEEITRIIRDRKAESPECQGAVRATAAEAG
jgi:hypothetical protein